MNLRSHRSRLLLAIATFGMFAIVYFVFSSRISESTYGGRPLSEWIAIHRGRGEPAPSDAERQLAAVAIRAMGTNALPNLLVWIDFESSRPRRKLQHHVANAPSWIKDSRIGQSLRDPEVEERVTDAVEAFVALGSVAAPAISELERRIRQPDSRARSYAALSALAAMGSDSVAAMTDALSKPWTGSSWELIWCVQRMGTNAPVVVPKILANLNHPDWEVVWTTTYALGFLRLDAEKTVPALTRCLTHGEGEVRSLAAGSLGQYGSLAESALPALTNILNDPEPAVRNSASDAIWKITTGSQNSDESVRRLKD